MTAVIITTSFLKGAAGRPPGAFAGLVAPAPTCRRSALHPGDFPVAGKVTKGAPRAAPLDLLRGTLRSPCGARTPSIGFVPQK